MQESHYVFVYLSISPPLIRLRISGEKKLCLTYSGFWSRAKYTVDAQYKKVSHSRLNGNRAEHLGIFMPTQSIVRSKLVSVPHFYSFSLTQIPTSSSVLLVSLEQESDLSPLSVSVSDSPCPKPDSHAHFSASYHGGRLFR